MGCDHKTCIGADQICVATRKGHAPQGNAPLVMQTLGSYAIGNTGTHIDARHHANDVVMLFGLRLNRADS